MPLLITSVNHDSPFNLQGISAGAVLVQINKTPIFRDSDIEDAKKLAVEGGGQVIATVVQDGELKKLEVGHGKLGILVKYVTRSELSEEVSRDQLFQVMKTLDKLSIAQKMGVDPDRIQNIILTTTPTVPNRSISDVIDIVTAECVFGLHLFKDIFSGVRDIVGGRAKGQQDALREARQVCLDELRMEAISLGADAVVGIDLDYSEISGSGKEMLFLVASGTAVLLNKVT